MLSTQQNIRNRKVVEFSGYYGEDQAHKKHTRKLSCAMAMVMGLVVTAEIMIAGGMIFNIDFHTTDTIALIFLFMVLYFGVVAVLTDK